MAHPAPGGIGVQDPCPGTVEAMGGREAGKWHPGQAPWVLVMPRGGHGQMAAVAEEEAARGVPGSACSRGVGRPRVASGPRQVTGTCRAHGVRQQGMMGTVANLESACPA